MLLNADWESSTPVVKPATSPLKFWTSTSIAVTTVWIWEVRCWRVVKPSFVWVARSLTWPAIDSNSRATPANCFGSFCSAARAATRVALRARTCVSDAIWPWSCTNCSASPTNSPKVFILCTIWAEPVCNTTILSVKVLIAVCPEATVSRTSFRDWLAILTWSADRVAIAATCSVRACPWATDSACSAVFNTTVRASSSRSDAPCTTCCAVPNTLEIISISFSLRRLRVSATSPVARSFTCASMVRSPSSMYDTTSSKSPTSASISSVSAKLCCTWAATSELSEFWANSLRSLNSLVLTFWKVFFRERLRCSISSLPPIFALSVPCSVKKRSHSSVSGWSRFFKELTKPKIAIARIALIPRAAPPTKTINLLVISDSGK